MQKEHAIPLDDARDRPIDALVMNNPLAIGRQSNFASKACRFMASAASDHLSSGLNAIESTIACFCYSFMSISSLFERRACRYRSQASRHFRHCSATESMAGTSNVRRRQNILRHHVTCSDVLSTAYFNIQDTHHHHHHHCHL